MGRSVRVKRFTHRGYWPDPSPYADSNAMWSEKQETLTSLDFLLAGLVSSATSLSGVTVRGLIATAIDGIVQGPGGESFQIVTFEKPQPASSWTIEHNLGHDPIEIEVITSSGDIAEGFGITHTIPGDTTVLTFGTAIAGTARMI